MRLAIQLKQKDREKLLEAIAALAPGKGTAEYEPDDRASLLRNFLPTPAFKRALDPNALIVVAERGAGKTELFRVIGSPEGYGALLPTRLRERVLVRGFGRFHQQEADHPDKGTTERAVAGRGDAGWRAFWVGLLAARLAQHGLPIALPDPAAQVLRDPARADVWLPVVEANYAQVFAAIDAVDAVLSVHETEVIVAYDELDRVVSSYLGLFQPIRALLELWLDGRRRWNALRPKIMLRTDLWESRLLSFPDASKLMSHKVDLEWQRPWLYQMLAKRMLNGSAPLARFAESELAKARGLAEIRVDPTLGRIPPMDERYFGSLVAAMVGDYMGANPRKGASYEWLPNHVSDALGRILPRPFLKLVSLAAEAALLREPVNGWTDVALMIPEDFFSAVQDTSEVRLQELIEGRTWLAPVKTAFVDSAVPMDRDDALEHLAAVRWREGPDDEPPSRDPAILLDEYLLPLGIFERRPDGRYNVPDIYRHGLKMKRKGGVPRRRA